MAKQKNATTPAKAGKTPKSNKTTRPGARPKLSALDAAAKILGETGQAMTCRELIEAMAAKSYWTSPAGRTPQETLYAALAREIQTKKDQARFRKSARGKFTLA